MRQLRTSIVVAIAVITGIIVLVGYFIELPVLKNLRIMLLHYAVIFIAVALIVGVVNLMQVHWKKFQNRQASCNQPNQLKKRLPQKKQRLHLIKIVKKQLAERT